MDSVIIGSGFSALCAKLVSTNKKMKILAPIGKHWKNCNLLKNRSYLAVNKLFHDHTLAQGRITYKLPSHVHLHDRPNKGGNSNVWGGFFNTENISDIDLSYLQSSNIILRELDSRFSVVSNYPKIYQLQNKNHEIMSSNDLIQIDINGFVIRIEDMDKEIKKIIYIDNTNSQFEIKELQVRNIILAAGVVQTIDILLQSGAIQIKDDISLKEYIYKIFFSIGIPKIDNSNHCLLSYSFNKALVHGFGVKSEFISNGNFLPLFRINQLFSNRNRILSLHVNTSKEIVFDSIEGDSSTSFGKSIHYCDLKINNVSINEILSDYNDIIGLGMGFVTQEKPGPISNYIYKDALDKIINI